MEWDIPREFSAGCAKYNVSSSDICVYDGEQVRGSITYGNQFINIARTYQGTELKYDQRKKIFLHEAVHAILHTLRKDELNDDEEFVDSFSNILCQVLNTME